MKKILVSTVIVIAFVLYGILKNNNTAPALPVISSSGSSSGTTPGNYKDGTYTGSTADAFYGNIQVQATISGGRLTTITFLQYPSDRGESISINQQADPMLAQEAIQTQNAQVDIISGATDTSQAFVQSLQAALDQAKS